MEEFFKEEDLKKISYLNESLLPRFVQDLNKIYTEKTGVEVRAEAQPSEKKKHKLFSKKH